METKTETLHQTRMTKPVIIKNLLLLSLGVMLLFTAYNGLAMVQSTMNRQQGIGVISQAIVYGGFCVSALLLPKYVITKLGSKRTYVLSMLSYVPYIASNFYPHWALMIPSAVFIGVGASLLWGSQSNYLNDIAFMYASLSEERDQVPTDDGDPNEEFPVKTGMSNTTEENQISGSETNYNTIQCKYKVTYDSNNTGPNQQNNTIATSDKADAKTMPTTRTKMFESTGALFFGFHGMAFQSSQIWTNLMTYFVLKRGASEVFSNATCACGADFCNVESECFVSNVDSPNDGTRFLLTGICTSLGLLSILVVALFLDPLEIKRKEVKFSLGQMWATCEIMKRTELLLLLPTSFYLGLSRGFYTGDFTKSYVGCAWGAYHVGLVTVFYGVSSGFSSSLSGWLVKTLGRLPVFSLAAALNLAGCLFLLFWSPDRREPAMFFLAAMLWGIPVGILWPQYRALFGVLFKADEEAAFAAFHAWYSFGFFVAFGYSNFLCTDVKIYVMLIVSTVGYLGYIWVEGMQRKKLACLK